MKPVLTRPSSSPRLMQCAASARLCEDLPDEESEDARIGTAVHSACAEILESYRDPAKQSILPVDFLFKESENGIVYDYDAVSGIKCYSDTILKDVTQFKMSLQRLHIEEKIVITPGVNEGAPDSWIIHKDTLYIYDYKNGRVPVFPDSWQLVHYASLILGCKAYVKDTSQVKNVQLVIVQPNAYNYEQSPVKRADFTLAEIQGKIAELTARLQEAQKPAYQLQIATGKECKDCPALLICEGAHRAAAEAMDFVGAAQTFVMSNESLAVERANLEKAKEVLTRRLFAVSKEVEKRMLDGQFVPNHSVEQVKGRSFWTEDSEVVIALAGMYNVNVAKPTEVITPIQAKKLGLPEEVVDQYSDRKRGQKIVFNPNLHENAVKTFGDIK